MSILQWFREWRQFRSFSKLKDDERELVVYSEGDEHWPHLGPIVERLLDRLEGTVCYVTSDINDPQLGRSHPKLRSFCIGTGFIRTYFFITLKARIMLMTMPDIETFHIKRSRAASVHYVYLFHSLVSTHMIYRAGAFDHFDTVFCGGPHHRKEIRERERIYHLPAKALVDHGYGRIDTIRREAPPQEAPVLNAIKVLVAPSWGLQGLTETRGVELTTILLEAGFHLIFRPHPMTGKKWPGAIQALTERFSTHERFVLDVEMSSKKSLEKSDVMISDWSGAALEYAFGLQRPVIFVDVPRKVNNPEYEKFHCVPLEVSVRGKIGRVVNVEELSAIPGAIRTLCEDPGAFREQIDCALRESVYNLGHSAQAGADAIRDIIVRLDVNRGEPTR